MIQHFDSVEIGRPVSDVFAFIDDDANTPKWLERCICCARLSAGPKKVGDKLRYRYREGSREKEMSGELVAYERNRRLAMQYRDAVCEVLIEFDFAPVGSGTQVHHSVTITPKNFMMKMAAPLIRMALRKQETKDLAKLKSEIESTAAPTQAQAYGS